MASLVTLRQIWDTKPEQLTALLIEAGLKPTGDVNHDRLTVVYNYAYNGYLNKYDEAIVNNPNFMKVMLTGIGLTDVMMTLSRIEAQERAAIISNKLKAITDPSLREAILNYTQNNNGTITGIFGHTIINITTLYHILQANLHKLPQLVFRYDGDCHIILADMIYRRYAAMDLAQLLATFNQLHPNFSRYYYIDQDGALHSSQQPNKTPAEVRDALLLGIVDDILARINAMGADTLKGNTDKKTLATINAMRMKEIPKVLGITPGTEAKALFDVIMYFYNLEVMPHHLKYFQHSITTEPITEFREDVLRCLGFYESSTPRLHIPGTLPETSYQELISYIPPAIGVKICEQLGC